MNRNHGTNDARVRREIFNRKYMEARGSNRIFFTISHGSINRDNITVLFREHGRKRVPLDLIDRFPL